MVLEIIKKRHSVRKFTGKKISGEDLKTVLEAGRLAPSWINVQPWHFIAVEDMTTRQMLSELSFGQKQLLDCSSVIVCLADTTSWDSEKFRKILELRGSDDEKVKAVLNNPVLYPKLISESMVLLRTVEQCSYPLGYMALQAQELGISSCIIGALGNELNSANQETYLKVRERLAIPDRMYIMAMLALGYEADEEIERKHLRKPFEKVVSKEKFGETF